jgi:hypothetical protein
MYSKLKNHPNVEISKKANMFVFSFQVRLGPVRFLLSLLLNTCRHENLGLVLPLVDLDN